MAEQTKFEEFQQRIQQDLAHYGGQLPERVALVWDGYLACAIEWGLISPDEHAKLRGSLPKIGDSPVVGLLLGKRDAKV